MEKIERILGEKIAGEIALSPQPYATLRKWRETFQLSQTEVARYLGIFPSVISDYESARRKSPGVEVLRKIIEAFIALDKQRGSVVLSKYTSMMQLSKGIMDIREYPFAVPAKEFVEKIEGRLVVEDKIEKKDIHGFTLIDSIRAISSLSSTECIKLYGWSTQRALIFTGITYGRSPMIAIRVHPMKPSLVVYHKPEAIDKLACKLAECEEIPLAVTNLSMETLRQRLDEIAEGEG
jgi:putative transcriptional regulator